MRVRKRGVAATLFVSLLLSTTDYHSAAAQSFNQFVAFGDSTVDSGWWKVAVPAGDGTGNAAKDALIAESITLGHNGAPVGSGELMNSEILASHFGLSAKPANQPGGTNYAISGSLTARVTANGNDGNLNLNPNLPSTNQQIASYLAANGGRANPNALYLIGTGGNDITFAQEDLVPATLTARQNYLRGQAELLASQVQTLQAAGARYIIVHSTQGTGNLGTFWIQSLWGSLAAANVNFIPSDVRAVIRAATSDPTRFGLTTTEQGVPGAATESSCRKHTVAGLGVGWGQWCVNSTTPSATHAFLRAANAQQTSLYSDDQHLSAAGQKMLADYDYSLVVAPSLISFLAEAPLKTRTSVITAIRNQIPISESQRGPWGANGWVSGDVSSLKIKNYPGFPDDPGTPVAVTAGFDFRPSSNWLLGVAYSAGTTKQSFSKGFGDFSVEDFSASLYAAYRNGPFWSNAILSGGLQRYDVNRTVPIGIAVIDNSGKTNGTNISFAAEGGYQFVTGGLRHGPLAGIILQRVHVDGFTETDEFAAVAGTETFAPGFTALRFDHQRRESATTALGYEVSYDTGLWRPFARVTWNHELASPNRQVTAFLTTATFAPGYSMPAVALGRDWASAVAGTTVRLSKDVVGYGTFVGQIGQDGVTNLGGQIGINVAFGPGTSADLPVKALK